MEKEYQINIAVALNSKYLRYTYVFATSLLENQPKEADIHMFVLNSDLTEEDQSQLSSLLSSYGGSAHFIHVDKEIFPAECPVTDSWPLESFFRLLLADIMPEEIDRLLYLDVDTIVNQSLVELYFTDFEGNLLCACPDPSNYPLHDIRDEIFSLQLQQNARYFNSGVLLINLDLLRGKYRFADYMKTAECLGFKLVAFDQDLLNYLHWNETKFLDMERYNLFARYADYHGRHYDEIKESVAILHYAGPKPWSGDFFHYDIEQLWWDYAKKTPFYVELMEEYIKGAIWGTVINTAYRQLSDEKQEMQEQRDESIELCQQLLQIVQETSKE